MVNFDSQTMNKRKCALVIGGEVYVAWKRKMLHEVTGGYQAYTAISREVVGKTVYATIPKGNMGYDQYIVPDTVAVEPTFIAFL